MNLLEFFRTADGIDIAMAAIVTLLWLAIFVYWISARLGWICKRAGHDWYPVSSLCESIVGRQCARCDHVEVGHDAHEKALRGEK